MTIKEAVELRAALETVVALKERVAALEDQVRALLRYARGGVEVSAAGDADRAGADEAGGDEPRRRRAKPTTEGLPV